MQPDLILIGVLIDLGPGVVTGSIQGMMITRSIFREWAYRSTLTCHYTSYQSKQQLISVVFTQYSTMSFLDPHLLALKSVSRLDPPRVGVPSWTVQNLR